MTIEWSVASSVLTIVFIFVRFLFNNKLHPTVSYVLWIIVALRLLFPVSVGQTTYSVASLTDSILRQSTAFQISSASTAKTEKNKTLDSGKMVNISEQRFDDSAHNTKNAIKMIWFSGVLLTGCFFAAEKIYLQRRLNRSRRFIFNFRGKYPVFCTKALGTPCLVGWFRPQIYITPEVLSDETLLQHTLFHEETHILHGDPLWSFVRCICLTVHWFNPIVWFASVLSRDDAELACDAGTLQRLGESERFSYGRTILSVSTANSPVYNSMLLSFGSSFNSLRSRIKRLTTKPKINLWVLLSVLVILGAVSIITFSGAPHLIKESSSSVISSADSYICQDGVESNLFDTTPFLKLNNKENTFEFCPSLLSSRLLSGQFRKENNKLILTTDDESQEQYVFYCDSDGDYIFSEKESFPLPHYNYGGTTGMTTPFPDGALFKKEVIKDK